MNSILSISLIYNYLVDLFMKLLRSLAFFGSQAKKSKSLETFNFAKDIPESYERTHWNLFQAVNSAIDLALESDSTYQIDHLEQKYSDRT